MPGGRLRMDPDKTLLPLIGGIYDAALNPGAWNAVLPRIGAFVGGSSCGLFAHDSSRRSGNIYYEFGTDPDYRRLYLEKYMTMDPMFGTYFVLDVGEVFSTSTVMSHAEFLQSRFYKEWIRPQGWIDNVCVYLDRTSEGHAGFAVFRHEREGLADEPARERMRLLVPHLSPCRADRKAHRVQNGASRDVRRRTRWAERRHAVRGFDRSHYPRQRCGPSHDCRRQYLARAARPDRRERSGRQPCVAGHLSGCRERRCGDWRQGRGRAAGRARRRALCRSRPAALVGRAPRRRRELCGRGSPVRAKSGFGHALPARGQLPRHTG